MLRAVGIGLSIVALWLVWRRSPEPTTNLRVATAVPVTVWGVFIVLAVVGYQLCVRGRKTQRAT